MELNQTEASPISASTQSLELPVASPANKNKKPKGLVFGVVFCAILAIAGVVFGIYELVDSNQKSQQISELKAQTENQEEVVNSSDTAVGIIDLTQNDANVRAVVDEMQKVATDTSGVGDIKVYDRLFPLVKSQNAKTLLRLEKSYGLYAFSELDNIDESSAITEAIVKKLKELGFVDNDDIFGPAYVVGGSNLINSDSGIICNISGGLPFTAECGHISWVSDESIALANKLSDAYNSVEGSYPFSINLRGYTIKDSSVSPYQTLRVAISNAMGLFYRTSPDTDWQYFTATQAVLNCDDFNTQDLKNAFAGETCYDGSQNSTVQP